MDRGRHAELGLAALLAEHREHLLDEERVALGRSGDPVAHAFPERRLPEQVAHQRVALRVGQRLEQQPGRPLRAILEQLGPRERDEQQRRLAGGFEGVFDEIEEGRLRPVAVVEDDHERALAAERLEQPTDGPEGLFASAGPRLCDTYEARDPLGDELAVLLAGEQGGHRLGELVDRLLQRPERDPVPVGQAPSAEDPCAVGDRRSQLGGQPRLADPGRAEQCEEPRLAGSSCFLECLDECAQLLFAADERGVKVSRNRDVGDELGEPPGREVLTAAGLFRLDRVEARGEPEQGLGAFAHEHGARLGRLREPGGRVDGRPRDHARRVGPPFGQDRACLDAHAQVQPGESVDLAQFECGPRRAQCIVLVGGRGTEDSSRPPSRARLDEAVMTAERPVDDLERRGRQPRRDLWIECPLRRRQIEAEHGHRLADGPARDLRRRLGGRSNGRVQGRILLEDCALELLKTDARLEAELVQELTAGAPVCLERIGLAARAVEREHQLPAQALAERVLGDQRLELSDQDVVLSERKVGLDPLLERGHPQLGQAGNLGLSERIEREVRQRRASPELEGHAQGARRGLVRAGVEVPSSLLGQVLELCGVDRVGVDPEQIAGRLPDDRVRRQQLAELRHVDLERVGRGLGRVASPELLDQCVRRDGLVPVQEQEREQASRLLPCELQPAAVVAVDFQRAQDSKFHPPTPHFVGLSSSQAYAGSRLFKSSSSRSTGASRNASINTPPIAPAKNSVVDAPAEAAMGPVSANEIGTSPAEASQSRLETRPSSAPGTRRWSSVCQTTSPAAERPNRTALASIACQSVPDRAIAATAKVEIAHDT